MPGIGHEPRPVVELSVSSALSEDRRYLLVHVLNLSDPDAVIEHIKRRYEKPLMEIFP